MRLPLVAALAPALLAAALLAAALALPGCESPRFVDGAQPCASGPTPCPDDYYCGAGQRCWKLGGSSSGDGGLAACGALRDCPMGALLCQSFEDTSADPNLYNHNGTATLGAPPFGACRGQQAFKAGLSVGTDNYAEASWNPAIAAVPADLYVRTFVYLGSTNTLPDHVVKLFALQQSMVDAVLGFQPALDVSLSAQHELLVFDDQTRENRQAPGPFPLDQWVCVELEAKGITSGTPQLQLFINDTQAIAPFQVTFRAPAKFSIGLLSTPADNTLEVWFDDVTVAPFPIGCSR